LMRPSGSITKVLRSTPMNDFPIKDFFSHTPKASQTTLSESAMSG
jgi:hypothetical protein